MIELDHLFYTTLIKPIGLYTPSPTSGVAKVNLVTPGCSFVNLYNNFFLI